MGFLSANDVINNANGRAETSARAKSDFERRPGIKHRNDAG